MPLLTHSTVVITAPAKEPVNLAQAKRQCNVANEIVAFDRFFEGDSVAEGAITAARELVEHDTRRSLIDQTLEDTHEDWPGEDYIRLHRTPADSIVSLKYLDTGGVQTTWAASNYELDTGRGRIYPAYTVTWPAIRQRHNAIVVRYVAGYGTNETDVPQVARQAMLLLIDEMFNKRSTVIDPGEGYYSLVNRLRDGTYP